MRARVQKPRKFRNVIENIKSPYINLFRINLIFVWKIDFRDNYSAFLVKLSMES